MQMQILDVTAMQIYNDHFTVNIRMLLPRTVFWPVQFYFFSLSVFYTCYWYHVTWYHLLHGQTLRYPLPFRKKAMKDVLWKPKTARHYSRELNTDYPPVLHWAAEMGLASSDATRWTLHILALLVKEKEEVKAQAGKQLCYYGKRRTLELTTSNDAKQRLCLKLNIQTKQLKFIIKMLHWKSDLNVLCVTVDT